MTQLIINVEIESGFVDSRGGIGRNGKPYEINTQKAWFYLGSKFPKEVELPVQSPADGWPVGLYTTDLLPALVVGDFGRVEVDMRKLRLVSSSAVGAKPAARPAAA